MDRQETADAFWADALTVEDCAQIVRDATELIETVWQCMPVEGKPETPDQARLAMRLSYGVWMKLCGFASQQMTRFEGRFSSSIEADRVTLHIPRLVAAINRVAPIYGWADDDGRIWPKDGDILPQRPCALLPFKLMAELVDGLLLSASALASRIDQGTHARIERLRNEVNRIRQVAIEHIECNVPPETRYIHTSTAIWEFEASGFRYRGHPVQLRPQANSVLRLMVRGTASEFANKMLNEAWPDGIASSENIKQTMREVRKALVTALELAGETVDQHVEQAREKLRIARDLKLPTDDPVPNVNSAYKWLLPR